MQLHRVQRALNITWPELNELEQRGVVGIQVVLVPDEHVELALKVGHPVIQLGGGEAVAFLRISSVGNGV